MESIRKLEIEREHRQWLSDILGFYSLSERIEPEELFAGMPSLELLAYPEGSVIIREGEAAQDLCIIYEGMVSVLRDGKEVAQLTVGAFFGEVGFLMRVPRTATILAIRECEVFRIRAEHIEGIIREHPSVLDYLQTTAQKRLGSLKEG